MMQADPLVADPSKVEGWNAYAYAFNRPTMLVDPSGLEPEEDKGEGKNDAPSDTAGQDNTDPADGGSCVDLGDDSLACVPEIPASFPQDEEPAGGTGLPPAPQTSDPGVNDCGMSTQCAVQGAVSGLPGMEKRTIDDDTENTMSQDRRTGMWGKVGTGSTVFMAVVAAAVAGPMALEYANSIMIEVHVARASAGAGVASASGSTAAGGAGAGVATAAAARTGTSAARQGPVVIGEGMKRVEAAASQIPGAKILNDMPDFSSMGLRAWQVTSKMMQYNRQWLLQQLRSGRKIIDIGPDPSRASPSIFYQMERSLIRAYQKLHPSWSNYSSQ